MLVFLVFLSFSITQILASFRSLERSPIQKPIRISYQVLPGYFTEGAEQDLKTRILPSGQSFFSSALQTNSLLSPLSPSQSKCGSLDLPEKFQSSNYSSDLIIFLHSDDSLSVPMFGKFCEQEGEVFKRPVVGHIAINSLLYFNRYEKDQIQYLIRETSHVLALDFDLFKDFVRSSGRSYSESQHHTRINYPNRGKTVNAIAFPAMLARARESFACQGLEGLEYEDFVPIDASPAKAFFWDSRVMPQDLLASTLTSDAIMSDITLALFEDSGWYKVNFAYSQQIKLGLAAKCPWHEEKCIVEEKSQFDAFCDQHTELYQCDGLGLGYGECFITQHEWIPPHESYISNPHLGGKEAFDYCPTIMVTQAFRCRDSNVAANGEIGERKGMKSRCLASSLSSKGEERRSQGACYQVETCTDKFVKVTVGNSTVDCPYRGKVVVPGFSGFVFCPESMEFCRNLPCVGMCSGTGRCHMGKCYCNTGWGGDDCSIHCDEGCGVCESNGKCHECRLGYFMEEGICQKCYENCLGCSSFSFCTSCNKGKELISGICIDSCLPNCQSCDKPCSICESGFFLSEGSCETCSPSCQTCSISSQNCTSCSSDLILQNNQCKMKCSAHCENCESPCLKCKSGYLLSEGDCLACDNTCKECEENTSKCVSCFSGYVLKASTCIQWCMENCLTCDDPCTICEDGYFKNQGKCSSCDENCMTCENSASACTSCNEGFALQGARCVKGCLDHCTTCSYPCRKCEDGFIVENGVCVKCSNDCKTCEFFSSTCSSCNDGYGLIEGSCRKGCADHCNSCDSPCTKCETGFFYSGGSCFKCDPACSSCDARGSSSCVSCAPGYVKVRNTCKPSCPANCATCDQPCTVCDRGFYKFELGCAECKHSCLECRGISECTVCKDGYSLVQGSCITGCSPHCISCDSPCSLCENGFYLYMNNCVQCDSKCKTCNQTANNCFSCQDGYYLDGVQCKIKCIDNCVSCAYPCLSCAPNYVSVDGLCSKCPDGCSTCNRDLTECYACDHGFVLKNKVCQKICLDHCASCDNPCSECQSGYLPMFGKCEACSYPCRSCVDDLNKCTSCLPSYSLSGSQCKSTCLANCKSCDSPCSTCEQGYFQSQGECSQCDSSCRTCSESSSHCLSCPLGQTLKSNTCTVQCPDHCEDCSWPCSLCKSGYTLNQDRSECIECLNYLSQDEIYAEFLKDFSGISLYFTFPVIKMENECGVYFKVFTIAMFGRLPLCNWVNRQKLVVVFGSDPEMRIQSLEMYAILVTGNDCSITGHDLSVKILTNQVSFPLTSISAPDKFTLGCSYETLVIQCFTDEPDFKITLETQPKTSLETDFIDYLHGKILVIPEDKLQESVINVTLTAKNFFDKTSTTSKLIHVTKLQHLITFIDAGSKIKLKTSESLMIRGMVSENSCTDQSHLKLSWKYIEFNQDGFPEAGKLVHLSKLDNVLLIPKGSLKENKVYTFRFTAETQHLSSFSDIQIDVQAEPLVIILDRSDSSFSVNEEFKLAADVARNDYKAKSLTFHWTCLENNQPCMDEYGADLIAEKSLSSLSIPPYKMKLGRSYLFTVKVTNSEQIASRSVMITATRPQGQIKVPTLPSQVNIQETFEVFPEYQLHSDVELFWMQTQGPAVKLSSAGNSPYLVISPNEMVSGRMYEFVVSTGANLSAVFSKVTWVTNSGPKCAGFTNLVHGNSVTLAIECEDKDLDNDVLSYVYGVKVNSAFVPLRVIHSPSTSFKLKAADWVVFVTVCDCLNSCITRESKVTVGVGKDVLSFDVQKGFTENLPVAILNNAEEFNKENFVQVFSKLRYYILEQELDLVHLKMAVECLEVLTRSNKTHFMQNHQREITGFLTKIAANLHKIDKDAMQYVVDLFSEHEIRHYDLVSKLLHEFSYKLSYKMPPGETFSMKSRIQLLRQRFLSENQPTSFQFDSVNITNLCLNIQKNSIYDIVIIIYPSLPLPVIDISYFKVGYFQTFNVRFNSLVQQVQGELSEPYFIDYVLQSHEDLTCLQLRGEYWIDEGCNFEVLNKTKGRLTSWHLSAYSVVESGEVRIGYWAVVTESVMLLLTIFVVALFCMVDKAKSQLVHPDYQVLSTQRDQVEYEIIDGEKVPVEKRRASFNDIRTSETPSILYHPVLNITNSQAGDRRAASVLHFSAVVFAEFVFIGGLFNPQINKVFDEEGNFTEFSIEQVTFLCAGLVITQGLSACLMCLNQVNDIGVTKRFICMGLSSVSIIITAGFSMVLAITYPALYSFYWTICFFGFLVIEVLVFESILWMVNLKVFRREVEKEMSRNVRVFTTES